MLATSAELCYTESFAVIDTEVRAYDDDGNELFGLKQSSHSLSSFGEGCGNISVSPQPNRGISDIRISLGEKDIVNLGALSERLCQSCLDKVVEFYENSLSFGSKENAAATGYCLVDFTDRQLYALSDPYRGYYIRDYYVTYDIVTGKGDDRIELLIFYAPERKAP